MLAGRFYLLTQKAQVPEEPRHHSLHVGLAGDTGTQLTLPHRRLSHICSLGNVGQWVKQDCQSLLTPRSHNRASGTQGAPGTAATDIKNDDFQMVYVFGAAYHCPGEKKFSSNNQRQSRQTVAATGHRLTPRVRVRSENSNPVAGVARGPPVSPIRLAFPW